MAKKVYVILIRWVKTPHNPAIVDTTVAKFGDWMRLNGFTWFVFSSSPPAAIFQAIFSQMTSDDSVLVVPVDAKTENSAGWIPEFAVNWLKDKDRRTTRGE